MKVFWFDVETGGLNEKRNPILQLAYIVEIDGQEVSSGEIRSRGFEGCVIEEKALSINGHDRNEIASYPTEKEMYKSLTSIFNQYVQKYDKKDKFIAGGYNVQFDMRFLREVWTRQNDKYFGSWFAFGAVDPSTIMRALQYTGITPELTKMTLVDLAKHFDLEIENAHDALADIRMTKKVMDKIAGLICVS